MGSLFEFDGKKLASVSKGELDLGSLENEADKAEQEKAQESAKDVVAKIKADLGDKVADVRATTRLTESPACLVVGEHDMSQNLQRMLAAAGAADQLPGAKPVLEINPEHMLVQRLANEPNGVVQAELSQLLYDQALLAEGGKLEDPASFVKRMNQLLVAAHA